MKRTSAEWKGFLKDLYQRIKELRDNVVYEKCADCECYFGLLFYLNKELTIVDDASLSEMFKKALMEWKRSKRAQIHACLGCEPCPPAEWTAEMIMKLKS